MMINGMERIGRYQIESELGRGAMGVVYLATDPSIGRQVAIKTIRLGEVNNPQERKKLRERLFREARSAGALSHRGIVTIYDMDDDGDLAFISMEFVDGSTLDGLMSEEEPIPPATLLNYLRQTAAGLDYAHQKGIVHRDVKPANIMIDSEGVVKITDFGIAKVTTADQFTMTGTIVGTPNYMSPEQVQGQKVDGRSDQFSLAVIAYEALTGEKPFIGEHLTTVVFKIVAEAPVPPSRINPTLGAEVEAALLKALAKKPDARFLSCTEFISTLAKACAATKDLKTLVRGGSLEMETMEAAPVRKTPARKPVQKEPAAKLPPPRRGRDATTQTAEGRRQLGVLSILLGLLLAAGLAGVAVWQVLPYIQDQPEPAPPPAQRATIPEPILQEPKPSPVSPPEPVAERAVQRKPSPIGASQLIHIPSDPSGATATLDGRDSCKTPCTLEAPAGRHSLVVTLAGYGPETREITIAREPVDLSVIALRVAAGHVMLSSKPSGAAIYLNGRLVQQVTPTQLDLQPGTYTIAVEKDGQRAAEQIRLRNGDTRVVRLTLE